MNLIAASLLLAFPIHFSVQTSKADTDIAKAKQAYETLYRRIVQDEKISLIAEVNLKVFPAESFPRLHGATRLRALARSLNRDWVTHRATQILLRRSEDTFGSNRDASIAVLKWLDSLDDKSKAALADGSFTDASIAPGDREHVLISLTPDPQLLNLMLQPERRSKISLAYTLSFDVTDPSGNVRSFSLPTPFSASDTPWVGDAVSTPNTELTASRGSIKFEKGEVLTLREMIQKLKPHLESSLRADYRIMDSSYFIMGEFERTALLESIQRVTHVDDLKFHTAPADSVAKLIASVMSKLDLSKLGSAKYSKAFGDEICKNGGQVSVRELSDFSELARKVLMEHGVSDGTVNVRPSLAFCVDPGGRRGVNGEITNAFIYVIR